MKESNRIEFKEKLTPELEKEVVAFLNTEGGDIFIGLKDDGTVVGVNDTDDIILKISSRLKDNIRPNILGLFDIYTKKIDEKNVIVVNLASGLEKPYYIKQKGRSEAGCFIRVGTASMPMTEENINKLMSQRHQQSLANIPSRHQKLEFSELILFYGLKKRNLNNNFAENLDFYTPNGEYNYIAYLFADNNNISVRIGKYSGEDKTDLIGREDFEHCSLITAMKKVLDRFDVENITQSTKRPMKTRLDVKLVDEASLHEVIINAFAHNDYSEGDTPIFEIFSDRFVITSFGGLVDGLDKERFLSGVSKPRNREIMRIFKDLEFVEQLGSGIPKIIEKYDKNIFDTDGKIMQTTLYFNSEGNSFSSISKSNQKNVRSCYTRQTDTAIRFCRP
jgi:predicted HTH transcriptional regulator